MPSWIDMSGPRRDRNCLMWGVVRGETLSYLSGRGYEAYGIDSSDTAYKVCKERGLNIHKYDASTTGFESNTFDIICALDMIEHVDDDLGLLKEMKRILKPNGLLIVFVPAHQWLWSYCDRVNHHKRRYSKKQLGELMKKEFQLHHLSWIHCALFFPAAAVILIKKLLNRDNSRYTRPSRLASVVFGGVYSVEVGLYKYLRYLPIGTSLAAVATKRTPN